MNIYEKGLEKQMEFAVTWISLGLETKISEKFKKRVVETQS